MAEHPQITNVSQMMSALVPSPSPQAQALAKTNPIAGWRLGLWQAPIEFYGRVVDENSNVVAGASVIFQWTEIPSPDGNRTASTKSDAEGLFSLHNQRGPDLEVAVSKEGYYAPHRGQWGFHYAFGDKISPNPQNPVVFHLHKKGTPEPLIHIAGIGLHTMRDYLLAADGRPTDISLLTGQLTPEGQADLQLAFQAGPPLDNYPSRITWQCQVTIPGGGLVQTSDEFPFLAPDNGYQTSDLWNITVTNWTEEVNQQYYVKLRNGDFGRVRIRVIGTGRPFFRMESFVNPYGSRNLEPAP